MDLIIGNYVIDEPILNILNQCKQELTNGKLSCIIDKGTWVSVPCPFHSDGRESHNSCGIVSDPNSTKEYGMFHCFTCGEKGTLAKFIGGCFDSDTNFGEKWLISRFGRVFYEDGYNLPPIILNTKESPKNNVYESDLNNLVGYHPYMTQRKLTMEVIKQFKIKYNQSHKTIVFPVWDECGNYVFNTERSVEGKTFYIPKDVQKPVYLLNYVIENDIKDVVVVESQINALTCYSYGIPAIALFGTGTYYQYDILNNTSIYHYYLAFDGDEAGKKATARFIKNIRKDVFVDIVRIPFGEDVNSLEKETFIRLLEESKTN